MRTIETRIRELTIISEKLKVEHRREYEMIQEIIKRLTERWEELQQLSEKRQQALESAQEIQKFHRYGFSKNNTKGLFKYLRENHFWVILKLEMHEP